MSEDSSSSREARPGSPQHVRSHPADPTNRPVNLDDTDRSILAVLLQDARTPNNALAAQVGIAASTCLGRVRALRQAGVIRGYHADVDPAALGRPLQAMIAVRLRPGARHRIRAFTDRIRACPDVRNVYFLAGADDFLLDVAAADSTALRDFVVDQLSSHPEVAATQTNLIFDRLRGQAWLT